MAGTNHEVKMYHEVNQPIEPVTQKKQGDRGDSLSCKPRPSMETLVHETLTHRQFSDCQATQIELAMDFGVDHLVLL